VKPLVSILIPAYNAAPWLGETLQSVLTQTWLKKEIIIVDDGSTDDTLTIAKRIRSSNIKVIEQTNRGASAARNIALREAQGDFIQFLDADDLLAPDKIETQMKVFADWGSSAVAAGAWARFCTTTSEARFIQQPLWNDMSPVEWLVCEMQGGGMMIPAAWIVPRSIAERAGPWNEALTLHDDGEYFARVVLASDGVRFCHGALCFYRSGVRTSLSNSYSNAAIESAYKCRELCVEHLLAREDSPRTRRACATVLQNFVYWIYPAAPELVRQAESKIKLLGGITHKPEGGKIFKSLTRVIGWKAARRLGRMVRPVRES